MITDALKAAYAYHRQTQRPSRVSHRVPNGTGFAQVAIRQAAADVATGKARYPQTEIFPAVTWQAPDESKPLSIRHAERLAYVDDPARCGLRHVGNVASDARRGSIWNNRGTDTGWITDPHGDVFKDGTGLCWGVVYQLPGRKGAARFVAGYQFGGTDAGPTLDMATVFESTECGSPQHHDAARDAARIADSMAQAAAESEREYQTAYAAGSRWNELGDEIAADRKAALALLKERRKARAAGFTYPAICEATRGTVSRILESIDKARREREMLASGDRDNLIFWPGEKRLQAAFNEGAGRAVI